MNISILPPSSHLQTHVEFYKILRQDSNTEDINILKGYPTGYTDLVISFKSSPQLQRNEGTFEHIPVLSLIGHFQQQFTISLTGNLETIWVRMKPHAAFALTGIPSRRFFDCCTPLTELDPIPIERFRQELSLSETDTERIDCIEAFLTTQLAKHYCPDPRLEFIVHAILAAKGQLRLKDLCQELGCSYKFLDRLFWQKIGQSPKQTLQNIRFKYILEDLRTRDQKDWMQLVVDHGFHDQAHLIREFRKYTSSSPQTFLKERHEIGKSLYA